MLFRVFFFTFFLSLTTMNGQDLMDTVITAEPIIISENRLQIPYDEASKSIEVLKREDIATLPVQSFPELLQYTAGMDIRRRGVNGVQADAGIRAGTFEQTLILVDGIKMNDPQTGHHSMYLPISLDDIERVEIVKGPASKSFGQNAFAGAINVITKKNRRKSVNASATYGSFNTNRQNINISLPLGGYSQSLSLGRESSDGYRYNTDYKVHTINYQSQFSSGERGRFEFFAGTTDRKFGANAFYASQDFVDQYEEVQTSLASLKYTHLLGNTVIKPRVSWRQNQDEYLFLRQDPGFFMNLHKSNRYSAELNMSNENRLGLTGFGLELAQEELASTNLGDHERLIMGMYLEHRFSLLDDKLIFHPGLFANKFSDTEWRLFPGVDLLYVYNDQLSFHSNYNYSNRIPTYTDLYYTSPSEQGNPNLLSEVQYAYELGARYKKSNLEVYANLYQNNGRNLIDWSKENEMDSKWTALNFNNITTRGIESGLDYIIPISQSFINKVVLSASYSTIDVSINEESTGLIGRYTFDHLSNWTKGSVNFSMLNEALSLVLIARHIQRNQANNDLDATIIDAKLNYRRSNYSIFVSSNNLTDQTYREISLVPMPGRWFDLGLSYNFNL